MHTEHRDSSSRTQRREPRTSERSPRDRSRSNKHTFREIMREFGDCTHTASKIAAALFAHTIGERGRWEPFNASNAQLIGTVRCSRSTYQRALRQLSDPSRPVSIRRLYTPNAWDLYDRRPSQWVFVDNRKRWHAITPNADEPVYGPPPPTARQWRTMRADLARIEERERKARAAARKRRALDALRESGDVAAYDRAMGREPCSVAEFSGQNRSLCDPALAASRLVGPGNPSASAPPAAGGVVDSAAGDSAPRIPPGRPPLRGESRAPERARTSGVAASPATGYRAGDSSPEPPSPTEGASAERAGGETRTVNPALDALRAQRGRLVAPNRPPPESKRPEPVGAPCALTGFRGCTCAACAAAVRAAIASSLDSGSLDSDGKRRGDTVAPCHGSPPANRQRNAPSPPEPREPAPSPMPRPSPWSPTSRK